MSWNILSTLPHFSGLNLNQAGLYFTIKNRQGLNMDESLCKRCTNNEDYVVGIKHNWGGTTEGSFI